MVNTIANKSSTDVSDQVQLVNHWLDLTFSIYTSYK